MVKEQTKDVGQKENTVEAGGNPSVEQRVKDLPTEQPEQRDPSDVEKESEVPRLSFQTRFLENREISMFPDDFLIINDVTLIGVPLANIQVNRNTDVFIGETLRSSAPTVQPLGRGNIQLNLTLVFPPGPEQSIKLKRLLTGLQFNPLVFIHNNKIKRDLGIGVGISGIIEDESDNTIFVLESGSLRSSEELIGSVILDLSLYYFNHKPFNKNFWFNATLPGLEVQKAKKDSFPTPSRLDLDELEGYESSDFTLDVAAESIIKEMQAGLATADPKSKLSYSPVIFPSSSKAYMYYIDHLEENYMSSLIRPGISDRTSDFIGLELNKYEYFPPPSPPTTEEEKLDKLLFGDQKFPQIQERYKRAKQLGGKTTGTAGGSGGRAGRAGRAGKRAAEATKKSAKRTIRRYVHKMNGKDKPYPRYSTVGDKRYEGGIVAVSDPKRPSGAVAFFVKKGAKDSEEGRAGRRWLENGRREDPRPWAEGSLHSASVESKSYAGKYSVDKDLEALARIIVSETGIPSQSNPTHFKETIGVLHTILNRWKARGTKRGGLYKLAVGKTNSYGKQGNGRAYATIKAATPESRKLARALLDGEYPDWTHGSTFFFHQGIRLNIAPVNLEEKKTEKTSQQENTPAVPGLAAASEEETKKQEKDVAGEKDPATKQKLEEAEAKQKNKNVKEQKQTKNNNQSRDEWIRNIENSESIYYYKEDASVQNVFVRKLSVAVDSDPVSRNPDALIDIVCSGITVSFGHRLAPLRLLGQQTPTWQFLGAGNKAGSVSFTYSGEQGRYSAALIKKMIQYAQKDATKYSALIPEAGSFKVNWNNSAAAQQNTILGLLNIKNIVVTDVQDQTIPGMVDHHQLVIQFINQDYVKETLSTDKKLTLDIKRTIIKKLLSHLKPLKIPRDIKPEQGRIYDYDYEKIPVARIRVKPEYARVVERSHGTELTQQPGGYLLTVPGHSYYSFDSKVPSWFAHILVDAVDFTREADEDAPPGKWIYNKGNDTVATAAQRKADKTAGGTKPHIWKERYAHWGAGELIRGYIENIAYLDRNETNVPSVLKYKARQEERRGVFTENGAQETNITHSQVYNRWLDKMNLLVDEVMKNIYSNEKEFDSLFGVDFGKRLRMLHVENLGECYSDMKLPPVPGVREEMQLNLPPEFYIYDDNISDASVKTEDNAGFSEKAAKRFIKREINSIHHYYNNALVGGSYVSMNLDKIINERRGYNERYESEWDYEIEATSYLDGAKTWEPAYYRSKEQPGSPNYDQWKGKIGRVYALEGEDLQPEVIQSKFMEEIVKMNPYLNEGRRWAGEKIDDPDIVSMIYGANHNKLIFGPNKTYAKADKLIKGGTELRDEKEKKKEVARAEARANINRSKDRTLIVRKHKGSFSTTKEVGKGIVAGLGLNTGTYKELNKEDDWRKELKKLREGNSWWENFAYKFMYDGEKLKEYKRDQTIRRKELEKREKYLEQQKQKSKSAAAKAEAERKQGLAKTVKDKLNNEPQHHLSTDSRDKVDRLAKLSTGIALGDRGDSLSLRRAFPTFKIYFIEDDYHETERLEGRVLRPFDDFYSYSAVQEIKVIRSRKVPADLAIIRMTNIGGKLFRRHFGEVDNDYNISGEGHVRGKNAEYATGILADTLDENPFEKLVMQSGVKVQVRLGYDANPDNLESVFLGQVVEISPSEDQKIIEIVCQGYGAELANLEYGSFGSGATFLSSHAALSAAILSPGIVNFGRQNKYNNFNLAEIRTQFTGGRGNPPAFFLNPLETFNTLMVEYGAESLRQLVTNYRFENEPQDDNIYAPPPETYTTVWDRFWDNACVYRPIKQTAWDIFKEHELRHPGYISLAVPYGHSSRMTMFFGPKHQHYWSKPVSPLELRLSESTEKAIVQLRGLTPEEVFGDENFKNRIYKLATQNPDLAKAIYADLLHREPPRSTGFQIGKLFGRYKPFRNYFHFSSEHHILCNQIRTSKDGTFNEVEIRYFEDEELLDPSLGERLIGGFSQLVKGNFSRAFDQKKEIVQENVSNLQQGREGLLTSRLDENIPDHMIRSVTEQYPSCITDYMAKRYAQGIFARYMRDAYKGELIVVGNPKVKPYDVCSISDNVTGMNGPVEVESVMHIFNREQGFISIITPDLCLDVNEFWSASALDTINAMLNIHEMENNNNFALRSYDLALHGGPFKYIPRTGFLYKIASWTDDGSPLLATPLTLGGSPFLGVSLGAQERVSILANYYGDFRQIWEDIQTTIQDGDVFDKTFEAVLGARTSILEWFANGGGLEESDN